jgi:PAS domain S-box-containing protein
MRRVAVSVPELSSIKVDLDLTREKTIWVLHVDDEPCFLKTTKTILEMQGQFHVDTASSVEEALEKMKTEEYDAVISDYRMPGKDGLQFLKKLRGEGNTIPFIIFTGKGREEVAVEALNLGGDGYFNKKGDPETVYCELEHGIALAVERARAELGIWQREERLRAILASSPDAITISDLNGNIIDCNEAALRQAGLSSKEEFVGKSSFDFVAKKDRGRALENMKKAYDHGAINSVEYTMLRGVRKEEYPCELSVGVLKDSSGNITGFVGILRDITERKKTEANLRRLANIVNDSNDAVLVLDLDGRITAWNKGAEKTFGYGEDEALEMNFVKIVPDDRKQEISDLFEKVKENETVESFETKRLAKDGRFLDVWVTLTKLYDDEGNVTALATTERDITERNRLQEKMIFSEKLAVIGQLASTVAHEIRNPMGVIRNSAYFLKMRLKGNSDEKVMRHLRIIENKVDSTNLIVSDLLDFARKKAPELQQTDLNVIVKGALGNLYIPENIELNTKLGEIPRMLLDPEQIQRVFLNVVQNAVEAMPEGGNLMIETSKTDDSVEISFKDSGVGILQENMPKLFTPLFSTKTKGLGLGLTVCKQIVESNGGSIMAKSKVGQGTTFTVKFPIQTGDALKSAF